MLHIAIMKKSWGLTQKILSGEKTIETRWYKNRYRPWDQIQSGDTIYFKDSGSTVSVKAMVSKIEQFENLDSNKTQELISKYGEADLGTKEIPKEIAEYVNNKNYAIIMHLKNPEAVEPFEIDKMGYGAMAAWICIKDLNKIKKK